jgi:type II secretion system protein H
MQRHPVDHSHRLRAQPLRARVANHSLRGASVHAQSACHRARGFTLLELMVVVVIIGLVMAGVVISMGATGRDSQLEQERDRLNALISYVRERGALLTLEYGIRCGQHGYRFVYYDNRTMQWLPETLDDTLRVRHLPDGLDLQLIIEGRQVVLDDKALELPANATGPSTATTLSALGAGSGASSPGTGTNSSINASTSSSTSSSSFSSDLNSSVAGNAPQILLLSDGDTNSFSLTLERPSSHRSVTLRSVSDGTVSVSDIAVAPQ